MTADEDVTPEEERATVLTDVSDAVSGLYESEFGRGADNVRTFWSGPDALTCFLDDTFTSAERNQVALGEHASVRHARSCTEEPEHTQFCAPVERITGRTVRSLHGSTDAEADGASTETFQFYPEGREGPSRGLRGPQPSADPGAPASADLAAGDVETTPSEHATGEMVRKLVASGTLAPLIHALNSGDHGLVDARHVLRTLVEFDRERLVQIALDTLIKEYVEEPGDTPRS